MDKYSNTPFDYTMTDYRTPIGFKKNPMFCRNVNPAFVHNRGTPLALLDFEAKLQGRDKAMQPFCRDPALENDLQFSTLDWIKETPVAKIGQPIPCSPVPTIQVKTYGGSDWVADRNMATRPQVGVLPMMAIPGSRI